MKIAARRLEVSHAAAVSPSLRPPRRRRRGGAFCIFSPPRPLGTQMVSRPQGGAERVIRGPQLASPPPPRGPASTSPGGRASWAIPAKGTGGDPPRARPGGGPLPPPPPP